MHSAAAPLSPAESCSLLRIALKSEFTFYISHYNKLKLKNIYLEFETSQSIWEQLTLSRLRTPRSLSRPATPQCTNSTTLTCCLTTSPSSIWKRTSQAKVLRYLFWNWWFQIHLRNYDCLDVAPIRLPGRSQIEETFEGQYARASGWGRTSDCKFISITNLENHFCKYSFLVI